MEKHVIGARQSGSRNLQAIARTTIPMRLFVVDHIDLLMAETYARIAWYSV